MEDLLSSNIQRTIGREASAADRALLDKYMFRRSFDRKALLAEDGEHCRHVFFILKGAAYSSMVDAQGERFAVQFALEDYWITDHYSFFLRQPGFYAIETLEATDALVIGAEGYDAVCRGSHLLEHYFRVLITNAFVALQYRLAKTNTVDATERYQEFSRLHPDFTQRIPQYLIASYLGIKPQSLSRIRRKLSGQE